MRCKISPMGHPPPKKKSAGHPSLLPCPFFTSPYFCIRVFRTVFSVSFVYGSLPVITGCGKEKQTSNAGYMEETDCHNGEHTMDTAAQPLSQKTIFRTFGASFRHRNAAPRTQSVLQHCFLLCSHRRGGGTNKKRPRQKCMVHNASQRKERGKSPSPSQKK